MSEAALQEAPVAQHQDRQPGIEAQMTPSFVFLASRDSSYMTGQVLHPNGGEAVGS